MSFLACEAKRRVKKENQLLKFDKMLDCKLIGRLLNGLYRYEENGKAISDLSQFFATLS